MKQKLNIITDADGAKIVLVKEIIFKGKRSINWKDVEQYLKKYVGKFYTIADTNEIIYIGTKLPDEYANSNYTQGLVGTNAKAKANAAQVIPELIKIATDKKFAHNRKDKHDKDAKFGWYRYRAKFALPVYNANGVIERYNIFCAIMLIRHAANKKMYLYDILEIKKETSKLFESKDCTQ